MSDLRMGSLFTGYGGLDMAAETVFDARTVWVSDIDPGARKVITHRYPDVPNLGDITAVDWPQVEPVDILTGGFPCQDLSAAGKRAGLRPGTRSGLWQHMAHAIDQLRPRYVIAENVRGLLSAEAHSDVEPCPWCLGDRPDGHLRALGAVLGDLARLGYDARWCGLRAADVGAPHGRFRVFILATRADTPDARVGMVAADTERGGRDRRQAQQRGTPEDTAGRGAPTADTVPRFAQYAEAVTRWEHITGRSAPDPTTNGRLSPAFVEWMMGLPAGWVTDEPDLTRAQQLKVLGNGVVPQQATAALQHMINADRLEAAS